MFIVGIETPDGQATYHYDINPYWDMFNVKVLEKAPVWDGHTPMDAIARIATLSADVAEAKHGEWRAELVKRCDWRGKKQQYFQPNSCSVCHKAVIERTPYCPNCGAKMDGGKAE